MLDQVIQVLRDNVDELEDMQLDADTSLIASGYLGSYEVVVVLLKLQQVFGVQIDYETADLVDFETPGNIVKLVEREKGQSCVKGA